MSLIEKVVALVAPHSCLVCSQEGKLICSVCAFESFPYLPSRCYRCKRLTQDFAVCSNCRQSTSLRHVWIRTAYEDAAKELIHHFKFERAQAAAPIIAAFIGDQLPYLNSAIIIPVPTATERVRQRGYDHSVLLAKNLARKLNMSYTPALRRLTHTRQVGANRKQRFEQLRAAFSIVKPDQINGKQILLVDDVITTGATLETLAKLLKKAGAKQVNAAVFAQKL